MILYNLLIRKIKKVYSKRFAVRFQCHCWLDEIHGSWYQHEKGKDGGYVIWNKSEDKESISLDISYSLFKISNTTSYKYLGIRLGQNLSLSEHIKILHIKRHQSDFISWRESVHNNRCSSYTLQNYVDSHLHLLFNRHYFVYWNRQKKISSSKKELFTSSSSRRTRKKEMYCQ